MRRKELVRLRISQSVKKLIYMGFIGLFMGLLGGLGAIIFRELIRLNRQVSFGFLLSLFPYEIFGINITVIFLPAIAGLIVGPIIFRVAPETKGHGVPEVIEAVHLHRGRIRGRVALTKILVSSMTIGFGGSAGREGPIAQIGASLGSFFADRLGLGAKERKLLVVCGLSAGIAGTFNAPLGGVLFGLEVLLGNITLMSAVPVILAAVAGAAIVEAYYGPYPAFYVPETLTFSNPIELVFYFILGIALGLLGVFWVEIFYFFEDIYNRMSIPPQYKLCVGGLATGILGFALIDYGILGVGYEGIELVLAGEIGLLMALILGLLKILATANTIGSGGSGGVFAPSLYIGAMYGAVLGLLMHSIFPNIVRNPYTYALVGMGAVFAAAAQAPLTMIIMIPEMTNDYSLLLPMMVACTMSYVVSRVFLGNSNIYTLKLQRRGVALFFPHDLSAFEIIPVSEFMTREVTVLHPDTTVNEAYEIIRREGHDCYPVVDEDGNILGRVLIDDILEVPTHMAHKITIRDIMRRDYIALFEDASLSDAIEKMYSSDYGKIFIVKRDDPHKLVGIITKTDIIRAHKLVASI